MPATKRRRAPTMGIADATTDAEMRSAWPDAVLPFPQQPIPLGGKSSQLVCYPFVTVVPVLEEGGENANLGLCYIANAHGAARACLCPTAKFAPHDAACIFYVGHAKALLPDPKAFWWQEHSEEMTAGPETGIRLYWAKFTHFAPDPSVSDASTREHAVWLSGAVDKLDKLRAEFKTVVVCDWSGCDQAPLVLLAAAMRDIRHNEAHATPWNGGQWRPPPARPRSTQTGRSTFRAAAPRCRATAHILDLELRLLRSALQETARVYRVRHRQRGPRKAHGDVEEYGIGLWSTKEREERAADALYVYLFGSGDTVMEAEAATALVGRGRL